jgi:hypothetical protein
MIDIFIPSYHRPSNIKTAKYFVSNGWDSARIHVVIDSEADDHAEYREECERLKINLHVYDIDKARERYDFIHRPSVSRRAAGMARNEFYDIARQLNITFYCAIDDDTNSFEYRPFGVYNRKADIEEVQRVMLCVKDFMQKHGIGMFGLSQTGDMFERYNEKLLRWKVMNTTFYDTRYIYRGERGVQDDDTSQFVGALNEGLFTASLATGIVLQQTTSAKQSGGNTDLYQENKLLNKAVVVPIQFPSLCYAERQKRNGNRLHHRIKYRYLRPMLMKGKRSNIAWNTYEEDAVFSSEPRRTKTEAKQ